MTKQQKHKLERVHCALPMNTEGDLAPGESETIRGRNHTRKGVEVDELAVSRVCSPHFEIEVVELAGRPVPIRKMADPEGEACEPRTDLYDIDPRFVPSGGELVIRVTNKSEEPRRFYATLMGTL